MQSPIRHLVPSSLRATRCETFASATCSPNRMIRDLSPNRMILARTGAPIKLRNWKHHSGFLSPILERSKAAAPGRSGLKLLCCQLRPITGRGIALAGGSWPRARKRPYEYAIPPVEMRRRDQRTAVT